MLVYPGTRRKNTTPAALIVALVGIALGATFGGAACGPPPCTADGTCVCLERGDCDLPCDHPPCNLTCEVESTCRGGCANGDCACAGGARCTFDCAAPPCHVDCAKGADCSGECANAECTCALGAACSLTCNAGPCHVACAGQNPRCDGVCANGTCSCGPGSTCHFECLDANCHTIAAAGARVVLECPQGYAGMQGCSIEGCAETPVICQGSQATTCGADCPPPPEPK